MNRQPYLTLHTKIILASLVLGLFLSACGQVGSTETKAMKNRMPTEVLTRLPVLTHTSVPSATPTATLSPTPTLALPVRLSTPLPERAEKITKENLLNIEELARYSGSSNHLERQSADGALFYIGSTGGVDIYDTETNNLLNHIDVQIPADYDDRYNAGSLLISDDGEIALVKSYEGFKIFAVNGDEIAVADLGNAWSATLSPNGVLVVFERETGQKWIDSQGNLVAGAFQIVEIGTHKTIYTWNGRNLELHGENPIFSPKGTYLATTIENSIYVWQTSDWTKVDEFLVEKSFSREITFSQDESSVAIGYNKAVDIWRIGDHKQIRKIATQCGNEYNPSQIKFSPNGKLIAVMDCGEIKVWNLEDGSIIGQFPASVNNFSITAINDEGGLEQYSVPGKIEGLWTGHRYQNMLKFSGDNSELLFWNHGDQSCVIQLDGTGHCVSGGILANDDEIYRVSSESKNLNIYVKDNVEEPIYKMQWNGFLIDVDALDTQNQLLFYTIAENPNYHKSYVKDYETERYVGKWDHSWINKVVYTGDNQYAVFSMGKNPGENLVIIDLLEKKVVHQKDSIYCPSWCPKAISPDGKYLAHFLFSKGDEKGNFVNLLELETPFNSTTRYTFENNYPSTMPSAVSFSSDGTLLGIGLSNGIVKILNVSDGSQVYGWQAHPDFVTGIAFSSDGKMIATSSQSGFIKIWGFVNK